MKTKTDIKKATSKQPQNVAGNSVFCHSDFTGKELDPETGYSYFGARYLDNALSTAWLSVDPMSDKYPSISPYAYCSWNPVKLVDPDGRDTTIGIDLSNGNIDYHVYDQSSNGTYINFYFNDYMIDSYKCTGTVGYNCFTQNSRWILSYSKDIDANSVFDKLIGDNEQGIGSCVEWNYYKQKDKSGDLITSKKPDEVYVTGLDIKYNDNMTSEYHHFHPMLRDYYRCYTPSKQDQAYSKELNVPCYLHFTKQNYRFDNIVRKYGIMDHFEFEKHIPLSILIPY